MAYQLTEELYVLPYGQMSLWGATVITNMLSAVPWIGNDFVQLTNIETLNRYYLTKILSVVISNSNPGKQFIRIFTGFVDGDGAIASNKTTNDRIQIQLTITLHTRDKTTLDYFISVLKVGNVRLLPKENKVRYVISRRDLVNVVFPLMNKYNIFFFVDIRRLQYAKATYIINNKLAKYSELPINMFAVREKHKYMYTGKPEDYLNLDFFHNWLIGFVIAEGSFFIKTSKRFYFSIRQNTHENIFTAFTILFKTTVKIDTTSENSQKLRISSIKDLQTVINFFSFSNHHPLIGYKKLQYDNWIRNLKTYKWSNNIILP